MAPTIVQKELPVSCVPSDALSDLAAFPTGLLPACSPGSGWCRTAVRTGLVRTALTRHRVHKGLSVPTQLQPVLLNTAGGRQQSDWRVKPLPNVALADFHGHEGMRE